MSAVFYRSVTGTIVNSSTSTLKVVEPVPEFEWGQWKDEVFPTALREIAPKATVTFVVETARFMTGCEGTLSFKVGDTGTSWSIYWDNPFIGTNKYTQSIGAPVDFDDDDDDEARCTYTCLVQSGAAPTQEAVPNAPEVQGGTAPGPAVAHLSTPVEEMEVLNLVATYAYPYASTAVEGALMRSTDDAKHWSPTSRDFDALGKFENDAWNKKYPNKARLVKISNAKDFVNAFGALSKGKCGRINLITHANAASLAFSGIVDGSNGTTTLGQWHQDFDPNIEDADRRENTLANSEGFGRDPAVATAAPAFELNAMPSRGFFNDPALGKALRDMIREKLAEGAEFHLYACNTGARSALGYLPMFLGFMANAFKVRVFAFNESVWYFPKPVGSSFDRTWTGVGKDRADAEANVAQGIFHNDSRTAFLSVAEPSNPTP